MKNTVIYGVLFGFGFVCWQLIDSNPVKTPATNNKDSSSINKEATKELAKFAVSGNISKANELEADKQDLSFTKQRDYYDKLNFEQYFSEQLAKFESDSEQEKLARKESLYEKIGKMEKENYLAAQQALVLKLAVLNKVYSEGQLKEAAIQLTEEYKHKSEKLLAAHQNRVDPLLEEYKKKEREIVKEVLSLSSYPDDLSREEYLRQRLDAARAAVYARK